MKLTYLLTPLLIVLLTGCADKKRDAEQAAFFPDQRQSSVNCLAHTQSANGARDDGMLYPVHFDGNQLSSLGKQKLSLMVAAGAMAHPMKIYLVNDGKGKELKQRERAVRHYLKHKLRPGERIEFVEGTNPSTIHPSAEALARMGKVESPGEQNDSAGAGGMGISTAAPQAK